MGRALLVLLLLGWLAPAAARAGLVCQPEEAALRQLVTANRLPALQVAFARDGRLVWSEVLRADPKLQAGTQTRFRIASISKCLTATALFRLAEQGRIDLNRPITAYFPADVPDAGRITPRLLAGHLAGIRHYQGTEMLNYRHYASLRDGLARPTGYSYGWFVTRDRGGPVIYHTGGAVGGEGLLVVYPDTRSVFAALWDVSQSEVEPSVAQIADRLGASR